jgi:hypothetical protein
MSESGNMPTNSEGDPPQYSTGEPVRVYVQKEGAPTPEDDWEYRTYRSDIDHEVAAKNPPEGGPTAYAEIPKPEFDSWQRERVAEAAGDLATSHTVRTTEAAEEIIEDEAAAEDDARASWGEFTKEGNYQLTADPGELSKLIDVPPGVITAAAEKGFPPETLIAARYNPFTAERLRQAGVDWGVEIAEPGAHPNGGERANGLHRPERLGPRLPKSPEEVEAITDPDELASYLEDYPVNSVEEYKQWYEAEYVKHRDQYKAELDNYLSTVSLDRAADPMFYLEAEGNRQAIVVEQTADRIEKEPHKLMRELRKPGGFPPPLRRIGWLALAYKMHRKELQTRKEEGLGKNYMDGLLRLGIPRIRRNWGYIKSHNNDVKVFRNKLSVWNRHDYAGPEKKSARRDLAELIERTKQRQEALDMLLINHPDVYQHEPVKKALDAFAKSKAA